MKIAYHLKIFPVLSQTFIGREIAALLDAGLQCVVIRKFVGTTDMADPSVERVMPLVRTFFALDPKVFRRRYAYFLFRHPVRTVRVWEQIVSTRYASTKSRDEDTNLFYRVLYLAGMVRDEDITHLHAPWADYAAFEAKLAAQLAGISYSVQARAGYDIYSTHSNQGLVEKLSGARFIITNSEYNRTHLASLLGEAAPPIHVIYNGVDVEQFKPRAQKTAGVPRIVCIARIVEMKGLDHLLRACVVLRERGISFQCDIFGGKSEFYQHHAHYHDTLMAFYRTLGIEAQVRFRGALSPRDVAKEMLASDVVVLPSVIASDGARDVTPNVLLEAMALGVPVVSTTVAAIPELVTHDVEGLLVPPGDHVALADALERVLSDAALRSSLGNAGRKRVEATFDLAKNTRARKALFDALTV